MIKPGDILLVQGTGFVSRIIRFFTRSEYSHVALAVSETEVIETDWRYRVQVRPIKHTKYDVYRLNRDLTTDEMIVILSYVYSIIGTKYDYSKIFSLILEITLGKRGTRIFDNPQKFICSDIIDTSYQKINIDLVSKYSEQDTTPEDISKSELLVKVKSVNA